MGKINDWFIAGALVGVIGGICHLLWNYGLLLIGIQHSTFWIAMGGIFYNRQLVFTPLAQVHGAIDAIGISAAGGILFSAIIKLTGRDYLYIKSIIISASVAYFIFLVINPLAGASKDSVVVPWIGLFGFTVFNGLLEGYILNKIYSFKQLKTEMH